MPTIADNYAAALLADAAYVPEFWDGMQPSDLETALKPRMTSTLAKFIADNFEIASTIDLEAGSGVQRHGMARTGWHAMRLADPRLDARHIFWRRRVG